MTRCCSTPDLAWQPRDVEGQVADVQHCRSCGRVHRTEKYAICLKFPHPNRCVNCGGDLLQSGTAAGGLVVRCGACGLTPQADQQVHQQLAALHPSGRFLETARALADSGRHVLALKLATAEVRWGDHPVDGMVLRLHQLDELGLTETALEEAYEWSGLDGAPPVVHSLMAQFYASLGDLTAAQRALERGLSLFPQEIEWWADHAELMIHQDDRPAALRSATKGLAAEAVRARCLTVIMEVAERYYGGSQYAEAVAACSVAGALQETEAGLAWIRARVAATGTDTAYMVRWLEVVVALDPTNTDAQQMLAPYQRKEEKKPRFWF